MIKKVTHYVTLVVTCEREKFLKYLIKRNGYYHYNRRVPEFIREYDTREYVRVSLKTDSRNIALQNWAVVNQNVEKYWADLIANNKRYSNSSFQKIINLSRLMGFQFMSPKEIVELPDEEIIQRVQTIGNLINKPLAVKAIAGQANKTNSEHLLSATLKRYWNYAKPDIINKNKDQIRKWENVKKKAVNNFILLNGDMSITEITNLHMLALRDWWLTRIQEKNLTPNSANKDFSNLKVIIDTVDTHEKLGIDIDYIFKRVYLPDDKENTRASFKTDFIKTNLLNHKALNELNAEVKNIIYAMVNTGARPIELVNLQEEDIILNHEVPHIHIRPRKGYALKTKTSERKIPIVGCALNAFKKYPKGFNKYKGKNDLVSKIANNFLLKKGLRPTLNHTLYSLRHSFQDRLTALELPDRIQCQLMGHKFNRVKYGEGASLEHLKRVLDKISFKTLK